MGMMMLYLGMIIVFPDSQKDRLCPAPNQGLAQNLVLLISDCQWYNEVYRHRYQNALPPLRLAIAPEFAVRIWIDTPFEPIRRAPARFWFRPRICGRWVQKGNRFWSTKWRLHGKHPVR